MVFRRCYPFLSVTEFKRAKVAYMNTVVVKVGVRLITVGPVVLVGGQNFTQEMTPHVSCCLDIER